MQWQINSKASTSCWLMTVLYVALPVGRLWRWRSQQEQKKSTLPAVHHESRKCQLISCCYILCIDCSRHSHIYGIDLASPSELIAHTRNEDDIAKHIGAEKVIFQTLDDLKAACAEISPRKNQAFEVGVFCGSVSSLCRYSASILLTSYLSM